MKGLNIILGCALLLITGCGNEHKAHSLAEDFMKVNMTTDDIHHVSFVKYDSTSLVSDSLVRVLQKTPVPLYKRNIKFEGIPTDTLIYVTAKYERYDSKGNPIKYQNTFYFDKHLQYVVAVIQN